MRRGAALAALAALGALGPWARPVRAAVLVDDTLQASVFDQAELETPNLTIGSAPRRLLVVGVTLANPAVEVSAVSWNGAALTRSVARMLAGPNGFCHLELWTLVEPAPGQNLLRVSLSGTAAFGLGAVSYSGVDPKAPLGAPAWTSGTGGEVAVEVETPADRPVLAAACLAGPWTTGPTPTTPAAAVGPSETAFWNFTEPGLVGLGSHRVARFGIGRARWEVSAVDPYSWLAVAVSIKPDGEVLPDAGPDAEGEDAMIPVDVPAADTGDAGAPDASTAADREPRADLGPPVEDVGSLPDAASVADVHLRVGCACRTGAAGGRGGVVIVMALAFAAIARRRRNRP
jgi:MYXO-CTERM domain-containing protein